MDITEKYEDNKSLNINDIVIALPDIDVANLCSMHIDAWQYGSSF